MDNPVLVGMGKGHVFSSPVLWVRKQSFTVDSCVHYFESHIWKKQYLSTILNKSVVE